MARQHGTARQRVRSTRPLPARAEVVVVGGGVVGASVAFHLAEDGADVLLVESGELAGGSSGKPIGGVRAQFSRSANVALGHRSLELFEDFARRPGADIGLRQPGYLFLLPTDDDVELFGQSVAMQRGLGVDARLLTPAEARRLNPYVAAERYAGAAYAPRDGWAHPAVVVAGYADGAERHGARVRTHAAVSRIDPVDGRADRRGDALDVTTTRGTVRTAAVVLCAGAWSRSLGAMAGLDLPVDPVKRQIAFTGPLRRPAGVPEAGLPFTIDFESTFYLHDADEPGVLLLGLADPATPVAFDTDYDPTWEALLRAAAARCTPELADVPLAGGWAGLYEMTPDHDALIGEAAAAVGGRVLYACGFSGHGFLQAPAVGEAVRDLYAGRVGAASTAVDVTAFSADRFAVPATRAEANII